MLNVHVYWLAGWLAPLSFIKKNESKKKKAVLITSSLRAI